MHKNKANSRVLSRDEVRAHFEATGQTVVGWALERGFKPGDVYAVLAGRIAGKRGRGHEISVALGLKPAVSNQSNAAKR